MILQQQLFNQRIEIHKYYKKKRNDKNDMEQNNLGLEKHGEFRKIPCNE